MGKKKVWAVFAGILAGLTVLTGCGNTEISETEAAVSGEETASEEENISGEEAVLQVGVSKQPLTLPEDFLPYYGFRGRDFNTALDELYVRVLALGDEENRVLFCAMELGDVGGEELAGWLDAITESTDIPAENIFIHAEHVHSAPYAGSDYREEVVDVEKSAQFADICKEALVRGCQEALDSMQPAVMNYNTGDCYINVNRDYPYTGPLDGEIQSAWLTWRNYDREVDHTVAVLEFDTLDGEPIAFWTNYAVHSEVLFHAYNWDGFMAVSGDIAGRSAAYVEERYDGAVCLFTMGAAADAMPEYMAESYVFDAEGNAELTGFETAEAAEEILQVQANELGEAIVDTIRNMEKESTGGAAVDCIQSSFLTAGKQKWEENPASCPSGTGTYEYDYDSPDVEVKIGLIQVGDMTVALINAEIVDSIGKDIQEALKENGCENVMIVSMTNGTIQYISDEWGYENYTFEATQSWVAPGAAELIVTEMEDLLNEMNE